jgi:hypothetical protein
MLTKVKFPTDASKIEFIDCDGQTFEPLEFAKLPIYLLMKGNIRCPQLESYYRQKFQQEERKQEINNILHH